LTDTVASEVGHVLSYVAVAHDWKDARVVAGRVPYGRCLGENTAKLQILSRAEARISLESTAE
jgi:hypothetical protein